MSLCVACSHDTKVIDTRVDSRGWRWRRRVCLACGMRFNTYEVPDAQLTFENLDSESEES